VTMQVPLMNMAGETVGQVVLADSIFAAPMNRPLMHQAMVRQLANARLGTHKVKGRSEVSGGGRKPWRQKGTGRARQGSIRAAQWRGGGIIFGPTPRSYEQRMPRKMRRAAVCAALSAKAADARIVVLDQLQMPEPKTREMEQMLGRLSVTSTPQAGAPPAREAKPGRASGASVLILTAQSDLAVERSASNLSYVKLLRAQYLNIRDLMTYDYVIIPQAALAVIEEILG